MEDTSDIGHMGGDDLQAAIVLHVNVFVQAVINISFVVACLHMHDLRRSNTLWQKLGRTPNMAEFALMGCFSRLLQHTDMI
jgi:hypothetical protein